eukprot:tig00021590_g22784.t1
MLEERCFRAAAAEAKQGSGRDWSPRAEHHRPVRPAPSSAGQRSACRFPDVWPVAAGIGLGVHACGRSGAASSSPSPSPSRSRSRLPGASEIMLSAARAERARRSRHQRTRSDRKLIFCLLSSPSEGGEVQNDLQLGTND